MAKDTIGIGVSNVARLMDAGWIGVNNVARAIDEVWIGDVSGKAQLAWKEGLDKVKAVFNGYSYRYGYSNQGGSGTTTGAYNTDTSKSILSSTISYYLECISKDGYYYLVKRNEKYNIYYGAGGTTLLMENMTFSSKDYIKSASVYSVSSTIYSPKFSADSKRLCYAFMFKTSSSAKYSLALVFWKYNSSTGKFEYEKDVCFYKDNLYSTSALVYFSISDDLSTILCNTRVASGEYKCEIHKGSPESGYSTIHSETGAKDEVMHLDTECGEYAIIGNLRYISGNTVTTIHSGFGFEVEHMWFSHDRSSMYISYYGYRVDTYKLNGASVTLVGTYEPSDYYFYVADENSKGEALAFAAGSSGSGSVSHVTLSKNANGAITSRSVIRTISSSGTTSMDCDFSRFYSTEG